MSMPLNPFITLNKKKTTKIASSECDRVLVDSFSIAKLWKTKLESG